MSGRKTSRPGICSGHSVRPKNVLLFVWDKVSGERFLVDTGAEVSVFPASGLITCTKHPGTSLVAANGSTIKTYGTRTIPLCFTTKQYKWDFIIVEVSRPLLGANFFASKFAPRGPQGEASGGRRDILIDSTVQSRRVGTSLQHGTSIQQ